MLFTRLHWQQGDQETGTLTDENLVLHGIYTPERLDYIWQKLLAHQPDRFRGKTEVFAYHPCSSLYDEF